MKSKITNNTKFSAPIGASLVVLSSFFYASYGIWTKLMGDFFDGYIASTLRSILVIFIVGVIAAFYHKFETLDLRKNWLYIIGMLVSSLFVWGPLYFAILHAGVGIGLAVNYAGLVIGMFFFGWLFASEHFTKDKALSAALGIIGLAFIFSPNVSSLVWLALVAALVSGFSGAAVNVFVKKVHYSSTQSTLVLWIVSVIANAFMAFVLGKSYPVFNWQIQWFYLVIFALASVIASWSLVKGLKLIDAGAAGILGLLEVIFGVVFGVFLFQERPTLIVLVGIVIIIGAAAIPYLKSFNAKGVQ